MKRLSSPWCDHLLAWLAPDRCASCDRELPGPTLLCTECEREVRLGPRCRQVDGVEAWACAEYTGPVQRAVQRFKFEGRPQLAPRFAGVMREQLGEQLGRAGACFVPVPMHPKRLASRGYNHAALLTRYLARSLNAAAQLRALLRASDTLQQSRLDRSARLSNLHGQFRARAQLEGRDVILVDDVLTTGATATACCAALRAAGAQLRAIVTFAHTD